MREVETVFLFFLPSFLPSFLSFFLLVLFPRSTDQPTDRVWLVRLEKLEVLVQPGSRLVHVQSPRSEEPHADLVVHARNAGESGPQVGQRRRLRLRHLAGILPATKAKKEKKKRKKTEKKKKENIKTEKKIRDAEVMRADRAFGKMGQQ